MDDRPTPPGSSPERPTATPLWVKVLGGVILVLGLLVLAMLVLGGEHGPGRHMPPAGYVAGGAPAQLMVPAPSVAALLA